MILWATIAENYWDELMTDKDKASIKLKEQSIATLNKIKNKVLEYKKAGKPIPKERAVAYDTLYKQAYWGNAPKTNPAK